MCPVGYWTDDESWWLRFDKEGYIIPFKQFLQMKIDFLNALIEKL